MKAGVTLAILTGVGLHLAILLFGGLLFNHGKNKETLVEKIDIAAIEEKKPDQPPEERPKEEEKIEDNSEEVPEFKNLALDQPAAPALAPLSLSDLESALNGLGGDGGFGAGGGLSSGGVIGGTGGGMAGEGDAVFSGSQLDQRPKLVFKVDPNPPASLRKTIGTLSVTVYIDAKGRVSKATISPQIDSAAEKIVLDAVRKWKYEPGQRDGKKVGCKVSHRLTFST